MSFYPHYQSYQPGYWGTQQYQLPMAPIVSYMPQAGWGPEDFYYAHSGWHGLTPDPDFFGRIMTHIRTAWGVGGLSQYEAQRLHYEIYSGLRDVRTAAPEEIGAAAAFEAMRYWETNVPQWQMPADYGMEEESIMGLAVAETMKLWAYADRLPDDYESRYACESAAATVHRIYLHNHGGVLRRYFGSGYRRRNSFGGWPGYVEGGYGAGYGVGAGYGGYGNVYGGGYPGGYPQGLIQPGGYGGGGYGGYYGGAYGPLYNSNRMIGY